MKLTRRWLAWLTAALGASSVLPAAPAFAQGFPDRPVRLVVPFPAGGTTDAAARLLAQELSKSLGQSVIVDNRAGANGTIGAGEVVRAPADGYTLLFATAAVMAINPLLYKLPFDPAADLSPIASMASVPLVLVTNPHTGFKSVSEAVSTAKAKPGKISYASSGSGGLAHLAGEMLKQRAAIDVLHVPYKGAAPALQDLLGNQVQLMFDGVVSSQPLIRGGKLVALAVPSPSRLQALPEVPTFAEAGYPGFEASAWYGVVGPKGMPPEIRSRLHRAINAILERPEIQQRLTGQGLVPLVMGQQEFGAFIHAEHARFAEVVAKGHIRVD